MKKLLVSIANYGTEQLNYLKQMIQTFQSFKNYQVTLFVHSNVPLSFEKVTVIQHSLQDGRDLPWLARQTIYKHYQNYDLLLYSENDHLITEEHLNNFLAVTAILPEKYLAGFLRYEYQNGWPEPFYPDYRSCWKWGKPFKIKGYVFAHFNNIHHGGFLLTQKQIAPLIQKWGSKFLTNQNFGIADPLVQACTDVYGPQSGYAKVIPISHLEQFRIHHLSNRYGKENLAMKVNKTKISSRGSWEVVVQQKMKELLRAV